MFQFTEDRELDIILLGRIALDINPDDFGKSFIENDCFHKFVGGSSANTSVGLAKMGCKVGFISCVSNDALGDYVLHFLNQYGIDTSRVARAKNGAMLGLAFTEILPDGKTNLMMYRNEHVADLQLSVDDIDEDYIASAKCIVISGTALSASPSREAALKAIGAKAEVDLKLGRAAVTCPDKLDTADLKKAVEALGFSCDIIG